MVCNIIFISAVIQKAFVIILFLPFLLSQGGLLSELKVGEAERQPAHREAAVWNLVCILIYMLPIINVWEFCLKSWAWGSFCSPVSIVVYALNGMQMWFIAHGLMHLEKIGLYKEQQTRREGPRVSNMFLWVRKKYPSVAYGETEE